MPIARLQDSYYMLPFFKGQISQKLRLGMHFFEASDVLSVDIVVTEEEQTKTKNKQPENPHQTQLKWNSQLSKQTNINKTVKWKIANKISDLGGY